MNLMIVESPGKVKKIREILGTGWMVEASVGHVRDLPERELGVELPDFKPMYVPTQRGKEVLAKLKKAVDRADTVFLATDLDREGEAIAWHLKAALKLQNPQRVTFSEITAKSVKTALTTPRSINVPMVAAQECRRVLDRLVGYMVSPKLIDMSGRSGLSAGRVQSPAVRIILERERAIQRFEPTLHFGAVIEFPGDWSAEWNVKPFLRDGEEYFQDRDLAVDVAAIRAVVVASIEDTERNEPPPPPFITFTLQQAASVRLKLKPKETMAAAQKLYEQGHITYMRTDNPNLADDALIEIFEVCQAKNWPMVEQPRRWKAKGEAQEAHEAIRPTHFTNEDAGETPQERALYRLIWARSVACQLAPARYAIRTAKLVAKEPLAGRSIEFIAAGKSLLSAGWRTLYLEDEDAEASPNDKPNPVPALSAGMILEAASGKVMDIKTKAPARFTEASLIKELERLGIGRPSTYASIIDNISRRGYVQTDKAGKYLLPTDTGALVIEALLKSNFSFVEYEFTRSMESQLDEIARGESTYKEVVRTIYDCLIKDLAGLQIASTPAHSCPDCGQPLARKKGQSGFFWGCAAYPACAVTLLDAAGQPQARPAQSEYLCQECGKPLVRRKKRGVKGKKGYDFFGCSGYPACVVTYPTEKNKPKFTNSTINV